MGQLVFDADSVHVGETFDSLGWFRVGDIEKFVGYYKPVVYKPTVRSLDIIKNTYNFNNDTCELDYVVSSMETDKNIFTRLEDSTKTSYQIEGMICGDKRFLVGGSGSINMDVFDKLTIDVKYPSNNIQFIKNVLPRLKSVKFI
jgi:putative NADH-flavin reductase